MDKANRKFDVADYDYYVKEFIRKSEELGKPITHSNLRKEPFCLPDARWYVKHCPDNSVTRWAEFVDWCGFIAKGKTPSKEKVISLIYKLQKELDRPLMYDDFRGNGCYHVPIEIIREYWGTINKMKDELGLEIIQESMMDKHLSKEEFENMIENEQLVEYAQYVGNYYGTPKEYVETKLNAGQNVILEIEIQGALKIKKKFPDTKLLFVTAPSAEILKERLVGRGTETLDVVNARLSRAYEESLGVEEYDYLVVNDVLDEAVDLIDNIITAENTGNKEAVSEHTITSNLDFINNMRNELLSFSKGE